MTEEAGRDLLAMRGALAQSKANETGGIILGVETALIAIWVGVQFQHWGPGVLTFVAGIFAAFIPGIRWTVPAISIAVGSWFAWQVAGGFTTGWSWVAGAVAAVFILGANGIGLDYVKDIDRK
jgi:hypothetical protein